MLNLLDMLVEQESKLKPENHQGYWSSQIPSDVDRDISVLIDAFVNATSEEQRFISSVFTDDHSFTFIRFSERMACLAVREKSEKYIFEGLIAHVIENGKFDWRENILVLSLLYHSAIKIGADPVLLFNKAAALAEGEIKEIIRNFPNRAPEDRSIEAMGYVESESEQGFCYKRTW